MGKMRRPVQHVAQTWATQFDMLTSPHEVRVDGELVETDDGKRWWYDAKAQKLHLAVSEGPAREEAVMVTVSTT